jgi:hypothetical protein
MCLKMGIVGVEVVGSTLQRWANDFDPSTFA